MQYWGMQRVRDPLPPIYLIRQKNSDVWFDAGIRCKPFAKRSNALNWLRRKLRKYLEYANGKHTPVSKAVLDEAVSNFEIVQVILALGGGAAPSTPIAYTPVQIDTYREGFHARYSSGHVDNPYPSCDFERSLWWQNGYEDASLDDCGLAHLFPEIRSTF